MQSGTIGFGDQRVGRLLDAVMQEAIAGVRQRFLQVIVLAAWKHQALLHGGRQRFGLAGGRDRRTETASSIEAISDAGRVRQQ